MDEDPSNFTTGNIQREVPITSNTNLSSELCTAVPSSSKSEIDKMPSKNTSFVPSGADKEKNYKLFLIVYKFLQQQMLENYELNSTQKESLEVAVQCLGYAFQFYEFDCVDNSLQTLYEFFEKHKNNITHKKLYFPKPELDTKVEREVSPEDIVKADEYKEKGNKLMKEEKFQEALEFYDKAINLNPNEPALYCNRAATCNNLKKYTEAIEDCNAALSLNSSYAKAYLRKGFAYEKLKNAKKALKSYKKAYHLEPDNEHYKSMYTEASKRLKQKPDESSSAPYNTMFLGPSSQLIGQLPALDNLMESFFSSVDRQW